MKQLRATGCTVYKAEHYNPWAGKTFDAFGFADILSLHPDVTGVTAIQSTSRHNISARRNKILASPEAALWLECGNHIVIHGWQKEGSRWQVKIEPVTIDSFAVLT